MEISSIPCRFPKRPELVEHVIDRKCGQVIQDRYKFLWNSQKAYPDNRQQRSKRMRSSALDGVKGLGPQRRSELVKHFGSVAKLRGATVDEIREVPGFGPALAESVHAALHREGT